MATTSKVLKTLLCLAAAAFINVAPVAANDDDRMAEAWNDAIGDQEPILTETQFAKLTTSRIRRR